METSHREGALRMLNKVPEVTLYFWMIKIMATTVGETAADFLNTNLKLGLATLRCSWARCSWPHWSGNCEPASTFRGSTGWRSC